MNQTRLRGRPDPRHWIRMLPPLAWMSLIYLVSDRPDIPSAPAPLWDLLIKKSLHALAYAILLSLWWWALKTADDGPGANAGGFAGNGAMPDSGEREQSGFTKHQSQQRALLVAFLITLLWAASDEWHQTFVPGRSGRPRDVLIDGSGALLAAVWFYRGLRGDKPTLTPRSPGARPSPASGSGDRPA